jgi:hypothetical protein
MKRKDKVISVGGKDVEAKHSFSEREVEAYTEYTISTLADDSDCKLPIAPADSNSNVPPLFILISKGVVLW